MVAGCKLVYSTATMVQSYNAMSITLYKLQCHVQLKQDMFLVSRSIEEGCTDLSSGNREGEKHSEKEICHLRVHAGF